MSNVLHVTDCLNAGVLKALEYLVSTQHENKHYILWDFHKDTPPPNLQKLIELKVILIKWNGGPFRKILNLRMQIESIQPDYLHLHSSMAGFLGRLFTTSKNILYSPHCFAFQRKDLSIFGRTLHFCLELFLSFRTMRYVANWPIEYELIKKNFSHSNLVFYPLVNYNIVDRFVHNLDSNIVISLGRLRPQKDPKFFADVKNSIPELRRVPFLWIGDGDSRFHKVLNRADVRLTGWSSSGQFWNSTKIHIITSKWESGPFTFYEALENGVPSIVRDIPSFNKFDFKKYSSPHSMALIVDQMLKDEPFRYKLYQEQIRAVSKSFATYVSLQSCQEIYQP